MSATLSLREFFGGRREGDAAHRQRLDGRQFALCCLTVLAALLPHASWMPTPFLFLLLVLIGLRWWQRARWPRPWPWWFRTGLMLALCAAAWAGIGVFSGTQGAGFLAAMLVSKLYEAERARDARSVATFASFLIMAQFLFQTTLWAMLVGLPGVLLAIATLASLHQAVDDQPAHLRPALRQAGALLFGALPVALILFIVFPRLDSPLWGNAFPNQRGGMGLSDRMEPGQLGSLGLDDRTALRVRFADRIPENAQRYFRGLTLWRTDGRAWTRPEWADAPAAELPPVPDRGIAHEITLEAGAAPWLPALDRALAAPEGMQLSIDHSLPIRRDLSDRRYQVVSDPGLVLEPFGLSALGRALGLSLPAQRNPRSVALARELRSRHADPAEFASRLLDRFRDDFRYSLEPPPLGADAVDEFLFDTQIGYCEHYASAYATLLRAGGVPARVVLGYQGGYFNSVGGYLVVRRSDAHAWVELWLEGRGWLRADPTTMVAPERVDSGFGTLADDTLDGLRRGSWMNWLWTRWDYLELRWNDWIVNYQSIDQIAVLQDLLRTLRALPAMPLAQLAAAVLAIVVVVAVLWQLRRHLRGRRSGDPMARWYEALRRVLASAGLASSASEPAGVLLARLDARYPELQPRLHGMLQRYQRTRYAAPDDAPGVPGLRSLADLWLKLQWQRLRRLRRDDRQP